MNWRRRGLLGIGLAAALALLWPLNLPAPLSSTRVLDRHGLLIAERAAPERARGEWVEDFPPVLVSAVLAAEDHRFYYHFGLDPIGIARALKADLAAGRIVQGGSTITQQLARNLWVRPAGLLGKLAEAGQALRLEAHLSKEHILTEYLNRIYYGNLAYGAPAAARLYLDKPVTAISTAEAALLAAIPRRPGSLDPWRAPEAAQAARDAVLGRMLALRMLSPDEHDLAIAEPLGLRREPPWSFAPHFVRRVLPEQSGQAAEPAGQAALIRTTLDLQLQQGVERLVSEAVDHLASRGASQAAVLVVDNRSAEVRAYVGSSGWARPEGQVDGVVALRSPGSALKPFLYELGLEKGGRGGADPFTLATVLPDLPAAWTTPHGSWSPQNYDRRFHGPVTARYALARSLNLPAVRLLERVGVATFQRRLQDLGLSTLGDRPDHYGLGLVLGAGEVRLDELVAAYVALANGGRVQPLVLRPDQRGEGRAVMDARAAWLLLDALDDPNARAAAFGSDSVLEAEFPLAAKTGTSVGWRDNWSVGVTPEVTVGVWVGNFDGAPMVDISGITGAGPLLRAVTELAQTGRQRAFSRPAGLVSKKVCPLSGELPGEACPGSRMEWFLDGTAPRSSCAWHQEVALDETGALATGCANTHPALAIAWPAAYTAWAEETASVRWPTRDASCSPTTAAPSATAQKVGIAWPPDSVAFYVDPRDPAEHQAISLRAAAPASTSTATWRVDGAEIATLGPPFTARWVPTPGDHHIDLVLDGQDAGSVRVWVGGGQP